MLWFLALESSLNALLVGARIVMGVLPREPDQPLGAILRVERRVLRVGSEARREVRYIVCAEARGRRKIVRRMVEGS
jgi:hypothetical protein